MSQLSEDQEIILRSIFDHFDEDKSGSLDFTELRHIAQCFGLNLTEAEVDAAFTSCDIDQNGVITFEELKTIIAAMNKDPEERKMEMERAIATALRNEGFQEFDSLTKQQFYNLVHEKGEDPLTMEEVDEIFEDLDKDGDTDTLTKEELVALFCS